MVTMTRAGTGVATGTWSRGGVAYRLGLNYNAGQSNDFKWQLVAVDRVGNASYTDADPNTVASQPYTLTIDNDPPIVARARTGVTYDDKEGEDVEEINDRSFIALAFQNQDASGPDQAGSIQDRLHPLPAGGGRGHGTDLGCWVYSLDRRDGRRPGREQHHSGLAGLPRVEPRVGVGRDA